MLTSLRVSLLRNMFGEQLSNETLEKACKVLKQDRDKIELSSVSTLRHEICYLQDQASDNVMCSAMAGDAVKAEISRKQDLDDLFGSLMIEIEDHLDNGGILI